MRKTGQFRQEVVNLGMDSGLGRPQVGRRGFLASRDRLGRVFALRIPRGLRVAGLPRNCYS